jgi:hypothetical protein
MAARLTIHSRRQVTFAENGSRERYPVWDGDADSNRGALHSGAVFSVEDFILEQLQVEPLTQYELHRRLQATGYSDPRQRRTSASLLTLRRAGEIKSERDGLARKSPRQPPFFSPLWELA